MSNLNKILATVLVVQLLITGLVFWSKTAVTEAKSGPLFPKFEAKDVTEMTVSDSEGNKINLAKKEDKWVLGGVDDFPADGTKITPLMEKIQKIETNRLVTKTDGSHKRLQVGTEGYNRLVEFKLADGTSHKLYLGSSAGAAATHVRADEQAEVYLTGEMNSFEANTQASGWIDTLYFTVPQTMTKAIVLENANGKFEFQKTGEITWTMKGITSAETFNQSSFNTLLNQITSLRMNKPLGKKVEASYGLDKPSATVTIEADQKYILDIGAPTEADGGSYAMKASNSLYYVQVAKFTGENLVNKSRADFLMSEAPPSENDALPPTFPLAPNN